MARLYYKDDQITNIPVNIDDTETSSAKAYSSAYTQGMVDTLEAKKLETFEVETLPTDATLKRKGIFFLSQADGDYEAGLYLWYNAQWNKFTMES